MKRALWSMFGVVLVSALVYYVMNHPNLDRVDRLSSELQKLEDENRELAEANAELRAEVDALRDDPRLAERRAREVAGMAKADEIVFQFERERGPVPVNVNLEVAANTCELAGKEVKLAELGPALEELKAQVPGAVVSMKFAEDVDAIRKQEVLDAVAASPVTARQAQ